MQSEPTRSIVVPRKLWLAAALLALALAIVLGSNKLVLVGSYPRMDSYRSVEHRTIVLTVAVAPGSWTRVTDVTETPDEIRIKVESLSWPVPLPGTSTLELRNLTVALAEDLGRRVVRDSNGQAVPSR